MYKPSCLDQDGDLDFHVKALTEGGQQGGPSKLEEGFGVFGTIIMHDKEPPK